MKRALAGLAPWVLFLALFLLALASTAFAQAPAAPTDRFAWDMPDPAATAQGYRWELEIDGNSTPVVLTATCAGAPTVCTAPIPAVTPSQHSVRLRAVDAPTGATPIVSPWSDPFTFRMRATPGKPTNITIRSGDGEE